MGAAAPAQAQQEAQTQESMEVDTSGLPEEVVAKLDETNKVYVNYFHVGKEEDSVFTFDCF